MDNFISCRDCGVTFTQTQGPGRPRVRCLECAPRRQPVNQGAAPRTCEICSTEYEGTKLSRYCSQRCKDAARPRIPCSVCGGPTGWAAARRGVDVSSVRCRACTRAKCGTVASYGRGCRCVECRAANTRAMREYAARRRAQGRPIKPDTFCSDCGVRLLTGKGKGEGAPRCSPCGIRWRSNIQSAKRRRARLERFVREQAAGVPANPRWPWVQGDCAYCGETFTRKGMASGYCSKRCRRKDKKTKWITTTRRMALYARDEWICQLCFEPVDRDADPLSDWAPTLDHIEPQSHALIPDHSNENLRTAHRWCNAVRGDGTYHADFF